jgi:hypothetical protein
MNPTRLSRSIVIAALALACGHVWANGPGLSVAADGTVLHDGKPYVGVGVNYFDCFLRTLLDPRDTSYSPGFETLARYQIPFARFAGCGFWPKEMSLYLTDPAEYFHRLDAVVGAAEKHGIGLIPSLFWNLSCAPDLMGEPCDQWGNPQSKTRDFMRKYVRDVVGRYRNSRTIWAWEFGNEFSLAADLPNAATHRPMVAPKRGTPGIRTDRDELHYDDVVRAFAEFAREVRQLDSTRLIENGDAMLRSSAWHNRQERSWRTDTAAQFQEMVRLTTPDPINVVSVHCYDENLARVAGAAGAAAALGKPLFVGEFQIPNATTPSSRPQLEAFLTSLRAAHVPLAAIWVYDLKSQEDTFSIRENNARGWELEVLREWNHP